MQTEVQNKITVYGSFGFVLGEFCRQFPEQTIRMPKHEVNPQSPVILYGISTVDNYNIFDNVTLDIETNLIHLMEVLDACHRKYGTKFEFNFISSWFVYGKTDETGALTEESVCNPTGFYSITKRCAEQLFISFCETFKIKYRIFRLANVLGHRDAKVSPKKNALQFLIDRMVHDEDIELYDGGQFFRDYIDVRDCAKAIKLAMSGTHAVYNISNGQAHKFKDLIEIAAKHSGTRSNIWDKIQTPEFHSIVQAKNIHLSNSRLLELGYKPEFTIEETIMSIVDDYQGKIK